MASDIFFLVGFALLVINSYLSKKKKTNITIKKLNPTSRAQANNTKEANTITAQPSEKGIQTYKLKLKYQTYKNQNPISRDQETTPSHNPYMGRDSPSLQAQAPPVGLKIKRGKLHFSHKSLFAWLSATLWKLVILSLASLQMREKIDFFFFLDN